MKHRGLGKGLSALLKEEVASIDNELVKFVDIDNIEPGIYQPRKNFEHEKNAANSMNTQIPLQTGFVCLKNLVESAGLSTACKYTDKRPPHATFQARPPPFPTPAAAFIQRNVSLAGDCSTERSHFE